MDLVDAQILAEPDRDLEEQTEHAQTLAEPDRDLEGLDAQTLEEPDRDLEGLDVQTEHAQTLAEPDRDLEGLEEQTELEARLGQGHATAPHGYLLDVRISSQQDQ
jgi:hypothetical protein